MKSTKLKFSDFQVEKISKEQQKAIRGGEGEETDPKNGGGGSGNN
ncbi:rSAM-modified peptide [Flavobacterium artemisiae]|uniref:RSAM-modified peptide n=1 Tax=Flavobacterium artemisiae TaxID=2126556 RepID=A0ABW4HFS0_9FLAO